MPTQVSSTYDFSQTGVDSELLDLEAQLEGTVSDIGENHVNMFLQNNNNYGYVGTFYLGSGEYQKIRILLDNGSANSWIKSKKTKPDDFDWDHSVEFAFDPTHTTAATY